MKAQPQRHGSALLIVIGIVLVVSLATAALSYHASQKMHEAQITREQLKARLIAESGLNKAYHAVRDDFSLVADYTETAAFGGGSYAVASMPMVTQEGHVLDNRAQLVSRGACGIGRAVVTIDLENRPLTTTDDDATDNYFNLYYDLLVGGVLDLKGNFWAEVANMHANGNATISGSAKVDAKTVSSAGTVTWKKADGTVILLSNQSPVKVVTEALLAAIDALVGYARENNAVYTDGSLIPASPPGGVAYCTGNPDGWSRTGNGCFIFAGDASFQGGALDVQSVNGYPAIIVMGTGEVKMNSGSEVHGAMLVPNGSVKLNGHAVFYGPILVGQGMTGNGTADLFAGDGQGFSLPPSETVSDNVVITAWH
jgi:hypothetical protein